ncbi:MAG: dihydroorotate dehydrogenase electron transfer subunit [Spirochaetaceae bacterium]|nr:dihydroorotate dehydrogenase electron transfer subunit [Spirochaetaceae bacterium]
MNAGSVVCKVIRSVRLSETQKEISFVWPLKPPAAGQFFMVRSAYSPVFLPRPVSVADLDSVRGSISFIIEERGKGTAALCALEENAEAELTGPLGNRFFQFLSAGVRKAAFVSGGAGIAPLAFFARELSKNSAVCVDFYAGFKKGWIYGQEQSSLNNLPSLTGMFVCVSERSASDADKFFFPGCEKKYEEKHGLVTDFFSAEGYDAIFVCGPLPMMRKIALMCGSVPCFISMERKMACGVGACLGCRVATTAGNRRCCVDGPVFAAREVLFED